MTKPTQSQTSKSDKRRESMMRNGSAKRSESTTKRSDSSSKRTDVPANCKYIINEIPYRFLIDF